MRLRGRASRQLGGLALRRPGWLPCAWLMWGLLESCTCQSSRPLATLQLTLGVVERDFAAQPKLWQAAEVGASFGLGDGVQTRTQSSALLLLDGGEELSLDPNTSIRFATTPPQAHSLDVQLELGSVSVLAAHVGLSLQTRAGPALLAPGTRVVLSASPDGLRFLVQVGQAVVGASNPLAAGTGVLIEPRGTSSPLATAAAAPSAPLQDPLLAQAAPEANAARVAAQVTGRNASVRTDKGWAPLPEGPTQLAPGTELTLERNTSVLLEHQDQRAVLEQRGRYVVAPRPGVLVAAASGSLSAGSSGKVRIEVPGGTIEVLPQGQVSIRLQEDRALVEVQSREASLETRLGVQRVAAGEHATVLANGRASIEGRGLDYADLQLDVGESLVIHDPAPPTAVRFAFPGACPQTGVLQLSSDGRVGAYGVGSEAVSLPLKPGNYRYALRCAADQPIAASGVVAVLRDAGTRQMAARQPAATLQADGRDYTVLYQGRLPDITLLWHDAPSGEALSLIHEFASKSETLELTAPTKVFASGDLAEGTHVFHFVGGGKISRRTTVNVVFDNAAPKASISTPIALPGAPGDSVSISGTSLPGWEVSIEGQPATRDAHGRFSLPVSWPRERRALGIRLSHPTRGAHVYLRRREL